jgi:hypothetical protein
LHSLLKAKLQSLQMLGPVIQAMMASPSSHQPLLVYTSATIPAAYRPMKSFPLNFNNKTSCLIEVESKSQQNLKIFEKL